MLRNAMAAVICSLLVGSTAFGQAWAIKMFETTRHDFGTVARGSNVVYSFKLKNIYQETVHLAGVRSSCGCSTPSIVTPTLKTYETGEIVAQFNTVAFLGRKSATITVTIDQPYPAEVQLHIEGTIRSDVVFDPGLVQFGRVDQGSAAQQKVKINYAGRSDWDIVDVRSSNPHFEVEVTKAQQTPGRLSYELLVRLKPDTPPGYVNDQLFLVTNDQGSQFIPLQVEGHVTPEITVSPATLYLGEVKPGEQVTKQLVVRGKHPFKILEVGCDDDCFKFKAAEDAKALHLVAVTFNAERSGKVEQTINIRTDRGEGIAATLVAYANVIEEEIPEDEPQ